MGGFLSTVAFGKGVSKKAESTFKSFAAEPTLLKPEERRTY